MLIMIMSVSIVFPSDDDAGAGAGSSADMGFVKYTLNITWKNFQFSKPVAGTGLATASAATIDAKNFILFL